jgi:purine-cytosine permease-like protein
LLASRLFALMFIDYFLRSRQAAATTTAHWHSHLHFAQGGRAAIEGFADLTISDAVTNANVHACLR